MLAAAVNKTAVAFAILCLLAGCDDGSGTFALPDGCYRSLHGNIPVLEIRGEQGIVLGPGGEVRDLRVRARVNQDGAYLETTPGFHLERSGFRVSAVNAATAYFAIEARAGGQAILAPLAGGGTEELRLGQACDRGVERN